jgi:hypothetical protein
MSLSNNVQAQFSDPNLGLRADWMRGTYGLNWKPAETENGKSENLSITPFLEQIKGLKTIDYIQVHLNESFTGSPVHNGPHDLLESFWQGDTDSITGEPINLIVPRAASGRDSFLDWLNEVKAAGLKNQVYINSSNLLERWKGSPAYRIPNPPEIPNITERWKNWCDTSTVAQTFINSQSYHTDTLWPERQYMFCYAEFVLKEYAVRYGDLIDAWLFDTGRTMWQHNGDSVSDILDDQRIYQAFADAVHAGNPDAAVAFNNGQGSSEMVDNPWAPATLFCDYMFGHPFAGGKKLGTRPKNFFMLTWLAERNGYVHTNDPLQSQTWDNKVIGHFDPPMSTSAWNRGLNPALTNEEFVHWYSTTLLNGGAVSLGASLIDPNEWERLVMEDWALMQLKILDDYLMENQSPGTPNWARQSTFLPDAYIGVNYIKTLELGADFWDPEGDPITDLFVTPGDTCPSWLKITESTSNPGNWILTGTVTDTVASDYSFGLKLKGVSGEAIRTVELKVLANPYSFTDPGDDSPVWSNDTIIASVNAKTLEAYTYDLFQGKDFYDFEGDNLTITKTGGDSWFSIEEIDFGVWQLSGMPSESDLGVNIVSLSLSDGTRSKGVEFHVTVDFNKYIDSLLYSNVKIKPLANTNYGIDAVSTMISDTIIAPDGLATFQVSIDVTPPSGKAIISGISDGSATANRWGIGDGTNTNQDTIFNGSDYEWVDNIDNIQVINFNANSGSLVPSTVTTNFFESIVIYSAESRDSDAVAIAVIDTINLGSLSKFGKTLYIDKEIGSAPITNFAIGNGDNNLSQTLNLWSAGQIEVRVAFEDTLVTPEHVEYMDVQIKAAADTNYGVDSVATMVSDTITGPDGLATFQVSIDVDPPSGEAIVSGNSGGTATANSWGIGNDAIFKGSDNERVDTIYNIQVINFNANGGKLTLADAPAVFKSVTVVNAQSTDRDAVAFTVNGVERDLGVGGTNSSPDTIDILEVTGKTPNTGFDIGIGSSPDQSINKWSIEAIEVSVAFTIPVVSLNLTANNGTVQKSPDQKEYMEGTSVTLTAIPDAGYIFDSWSGDVTDSTNPLTVTMDTDKSITANFIIGTYNSAEFMNVQIKASADTDYRVGNVATMISDTITAPDSLATFQVSIDVTPPAGKAIMSGSSGGVATANAWGFGGDGRDGTKELLFWGSNNDWAENINNIQIINFNANGGDLVPSSVGGIFKTVSIVNGQSGSKDAVAFVVNGDTTDLSDLVSTPETVDLEAVTGIDQITNFSLGSGNSPDQSLNKWAVEGIEVSVGFEVIEYANVQIKASADTDYGVGNVATMISGIITAPDNLATYQVSIDVTPPSGKAIMSGISGGASTVNAWGFGGDGRDGTKELLFWGSNNDWVENINNIQIINFNANGGELIPATVEGIFKSVSIVNGHSGAKDAVAFVVNGDTTDIGDLTSNPETIDLETVTGANQITSFTLGNGASPDQPSNKWSVEGIDVRVGFNTVGSTLNKSVTNVNIVEKVDKFAKVEKQNTVVIYPNPAKESLTIDFGVHETVKYRLINTLGQVVQTGNFDNRKTVVYLNSINRGFYILELITSKGRSSHKIIIE